MRDFRGNSRFGRRDGGRPMMHQAVCDNCGKNCEVPFQPTGEKPVYCNECFAAQGGRERTNQTSYGPRRFPNRDSGRPPYRREGAGKDYGKEIAVINTKLDKIMAAMGLLEKAEPEPKEAMEQTTEPLATSEEIPMADDLMATEQ